MSASRRAAGTLALLVGSAVFGCLAGCLAACSGNDASAPRGPDAAPPPASTTLVILATDGEGGPFVPAKAVLVGEDGKPLRIGTLDMYNGSAQDKGFCQLAGGVIGTFEGIMLVDGTGEIPVGEDGCAPTPAVPFGTYTVQVSRGIEYEIFETTVTLAPKQGRVVVEAPLERAWTPPTDALAADLHVHTEPSKDSNVPAWVRVASELVTGMQVVGTSDHNFNGSFDTVIDDMGLRGQIASVPGNEVSVDMVHANIFPAPITPGVDRNGAKSFDELKTLTAAQFWAYLRTIPGGPLVQVNHPRLRFAAYFDYAGWNGVAWPPPMPLDFDVVEVLNGMAAFNKPGDRRIEQSIGDLYTFLAHGKLVAGTGNSDTHHLSSVLAGVPRNYVFVRDRRLDAFDTSGFVDALRARRVVVTTGPWLDVSTSDGAGAGELARPEGGKVGLHIGLRQASFVHANRIRIWVGTQLRQTLDVPAGARAFDWDGQIDVGAIDTFIGVDALGDDVLPTSLTGDFLYWTQQSGVAPAAFVNPILVDGNGDGRWGGPQAPLATPDLLPPPAGDRHEPYECGEAQVEPAKR